MNDDIKVTRALSNLNKLTKEGSIKWEKKIIPKDWFPGDVDEKVINPAFDCQYDSSYMRIFKYIYKSYQDIDEYHEVLGVKLCFLDLSGNIVWAFHHDRIIHDLYETITYKLSGIESIINKLSENYKDDEFQMF